MKKCSLVVFFEFEHCSLSPAKKSIEKNVAVKHFIIQLFMHEKNQTEIHFSHSPKLHLSTWQPTAFVLWIEKERQEFNFIRLTSFGNLFHTFGFFQYTSFRFALFSGQTYT